MNLEKVAARIARYKQTMLGYPLNMQFDSSGLSQLLGTVLNNLGDPQSDPTLKVSTFKEELEVVDYFDNLYSFPKGYWGYVTTGGSEGNFKGLIDGKTLFPNAITYITEDAHYSLQKMASLLKGEVRTIRSFRGCMSWADFSSKYNPRKPAVVGITAGTTMHGGVDLVPDELVGKDNVYIHLDAALMGLVYPFTESSYITGYSQGYNSISVSGHKMLGCPTPCGVFLSSKRVTDNKIDYISSYDSTLLGSRSGFSVLCMLQALNTLDLQEIVDKCLENAYYAEDLLESRGIKCGRYKDSITIFFRKPSEWICDKWQLASANKIAHIIMMPHVSKKMIDLFVEDMTQNRCFCLRTNNELSQQLARS